MGAFDKIVAAVSPRRACEREAWRQQLEILRGYDAAGYGRLNAGWRVQRRGQSQNGHQQDGQQEGGGVLLVQQGDRQRQEHEECLDQQDAAHQPGYQFQIHDMPPGAEKVCSPSS